MRFVKMEGLGNDFIVLEGPADPSPRQIGLWCDRMRGIGADGVLEVTPIDAQTVRMRYWNADGGEAEMCGTTRTFNLDIWDSWQQRLEKVIRGVCESMGADFEFKFSRGYPPTVNDESMSEVVRRCAAQIVGQEKVVEPDRSMGGEDMSYFLQRSKGCFFALGTGRDGYAAIHNPRFMFNEDILPLGVETHCRVALELLGSGVQRFRVQGSEFWVLGFEVQWF